MATFKKAINEYKPMKRLLNPEAPFRSKPHVSTWFITLNSNKESSLSLSEELIGDNLVRVLKNTFEKPSNLVQFLQFNNQVLDGDYKLTEKMITDKTLFPELSVTYVQETGSKKHRVHLHAEFKVFHYSILRLDHQKLQQMIKESLDDTPFNSVYLNARYIKSHVPLENYITKSMNEKATKLVKDDDEILNMLNNLTIN